MSGTLALYCQSKSHDVEMFMFQIFEVLETVGFKYHRDRRQRAPFDMEI